MGDYMFLSENIMDILKFIGPHHVSKFRFGFHFFNRQLKIFKSKYLFRQSSPDESIKSKEM